MNENPISAAAAGTWQLGDLTVNRMGFGAMRLSQTGQALIAGAASGERGRALAVLRRAVELGVNHIDTAAFYFSPLRSANELINTALAPYPASRQEHDFVDACGQQGVAFVPFFAIAGRGAGAGAAGTEPEAEVAAVAAARGVTTAQVRLAWTLQRGPHVLAIPGTGNPEHLAANIAAAGLRLTEAEMTRLTSITAPEPPRVR